MEVWVLEEYWPDDGSSDIHGVFENADVGMNSVKKENIIWTEHTTYWSSNNIGNKIYYLSKFEVVLDEPPIIKN